METLALWLIWTSLVYSLLFIIVFNGINYYEEGGFEKLYKSLSIKISNFKQELKFSAANYLKTLDMLKRLLLK